MARLPAFHGKWWNHAELKNKDWMVQIDNQAFYGTAVNAACNAAARINDLYDNAVLSNELMAYANRNIDKIMAYLGTRPFTFVHGDYHAKQMFFPTESGGKFAVIDWQFPFVASGAWDFARMLGMGLPSVRRRELEPALLKGYCDGLITNGVSHYSQEELEVDYRLGLFISQLIMCIAHGDTDVEIMEKECRVLNVDWQDIMLYRTQDALVQWDVLGFLKSI